MPSQRLDELVRLTETAGARLYRKDLVAALLLAAPEDPEELLQLFLRYRTATAADAAIGEASDGTVLKLERPKPGRRPRASWSRPDSAANSRRKLHRSRVLVAVENVRWPVVVSRGGLPGSSRLKQRDG